MRRALLRAVVLSATPLLVVLAAAPALAVTPDDGDDPGAGLSVLQTLAVFVGVPALLFFGIAALVMLPSAAKGPRYRPGVGWWAESVWLNGPDGADAASVAGTPARLTEATTAGGGASARW